MLVSHSQIESGKWDDDSCQPCETSARNRLSIAMVYAILCQTFDFFLLQMAELVHQLYLDVPVCITQHGFQSMYLQARTTWSHKNEEFLVIQQRPAFPHRRFKKCEMLILSNLVIGQPPSPQKHISRTSKIAPTQSWISFHSCHFSCC